MKFARYLQDTQTPEWKRAYIDYRGLKKRINAIRRAQEGLEALTDSDSPVPRSHPNLPAPPRRSSIGSTAASQSDQHFATRSFGDFNDEDAAVENKKQPNFILSASRRRLSGIARTDEEVASQEVDVPPETSQYPERGPSNVNLQSARRPSIVQTVTSSLRKNTFLSGGPKKGSRTAGNSTQLQLFSSPLPLHVLLPLLSPVETAFFTYLDAQLEKIEAFYLDREKEMDIMFQVLGEQLRELSDHRRLFYSTYTPSNKSWASALKATLDVKSKISAHKTLTRKRREGRMRVEGSDAKRGITAKDHDDAQSGEDIDCSNAGESSTSATANLLLSKVQSTSKESGDGSDVKGGAEAKKKAGHGHGNGVPELDPEDYPHAKKKLKKAVLEHYRGLEVLQNYRILNLTGFRKALKKFEKVTKIPAQQTYMKEKVEPSAFASGERVGTMIKQMEELFASRFEHGDKKKAMTRLRAGTEQKSHHLSSFFSGLLIGLALPALVSGLYQSFHEETRRSIPAWDALLFIYGILFVPTVFAVLVGVNLLVWSQSRINYVFIFELDVRTHLDPREYFQTPSILLASLCYAFWLSFSRIGAPGISPTVWPLVWLLLVVVLVLDPLPLLYKPSRWWLLKSVGKLLISGTRRVEFADFWMGDQFCSLIFTLSNLYLVGCVYSSGFTESWQHCGSSSPNWGVALALASLPLLVRLVQSVKRYVDSKLITHLINGGKYGSGIISYLLYYNWRHRGSQRGAAFALWCIFNTIYSIYAGCWDLLMDWSVLKPRAKYPLLRPELVYSDNIPMYYFAIVSNMVLRFGWVLYILRTPSPVLLSFILGMLEMLRRWQWNFYRLENEHLGNMDQYRVTREVPLPYSINDMPPDDDADDDGEDRVSIKSKIFGHRTPAATTMPPQRLSDD